MAKSKMNVRLLRKVQKHILEEPKRYDQDIVAKASSEAPCGTACCIAGWAEVLGNSKSPAVKRLTTGRPGGVVMAKKRKIVEVKQEAVAAPMKDDATETAAEVKKILCNIVETAQSFAGKHGSTSQQKRAEAMQGVGK